MPVQSPLTAIADQRRAELAAIGVYRTTEAGPYNSSNPKVFSEGYGSASLDNWGKEPLTPPNPAQPFDTYKTVGGKDDIEARIGLNSPGSLAKNDYWLGGTPYSRNHPTDIFSDGDNLGKEPLPNTPNNPLSQYNGVGSQSDINARVGGGPGIAQDSLISSNRYNAIGKEYVKNSPDTYSEGPTGDNRGKDPLPNTPNNAISQYNAVGGQDDIRARIVGGPKIAQDSLLSSNRYNVIGKEYIKNSPDTYSEGPTGDNRGKDPLPNIPNTYAGQYNNIGSKHDITSRIIGNPLVPTNSLISSNKYNALGQIYDSVTI